MSPVHKETSPAAAHWGNWLPVVAHSNFYIGGGHDPKAKLIQKAVEQFLQGSHEDEINTSPGLISKWIINNDPEDDGFGFTDDYGEQYEESKSEEDEVDKWLYDNSKKTDLKLKMLEQREMIESSVRNDMNMRPDAIMSWIKQS